MRLFLSGLLICSLLFQNIGKTITVLSFLSNQDFITRNLCENRAKPEMHCNGKCHLRKQIKKDEQEIPKIPASVKNYETLSESVCENLFAGFIFASSSDFVFPESGNFSEQDFLRSVFHPPTVNC